jgi:hypothetical protein
MMLTLDPFCVARDRSRNVDVELHLGHWTQRSAAGDVEGRGRVDTKKILARRQQTKYVDLAIRWEGGSEQVTAEISFMSSPKRSPERTAITLHEELVITPT